MKKIEEELLDQIILDQFECDEDWYKSKANHTTSYLDVEGDTIIRICRNTEFIQAIRSMIKIKEKYAKIDGENTVQSKIKNAFKFLFPDN